MMQLRQQHHHVVPSSTQMASSSTSSRRSRFGRRSPDCKKKTRKYNAKEDRTLRALEAIRLLSFDIHTDASPKKSSPLTPRTVTTILSDDATEEESYDDSRTLKKPTAERPKSQVLRPLPMIDRNSSGGTRQRSDSNMSYLSDTSSEMGDWPSSVGDEQDYPRYICISHTSGGYSNDYTPSSSSSRYSQLQQTHLKTRRLSTAAVEEWNRRCEEEVGVFRRETYTSEMLTNQSKTLDHRHSCSLPIESDYFCDFSFDETDDDDISLTYSHDE